MKLAFWLLPWLCSLAAAAPLELSRRVYATGGLPLLSHTGSAPFSAYLIQSVPFAPVNELRQRWETHLGYKLKHRGEAHLTVVTPVEYDLALKGTLSIQEIHRMAAAARLQSLPFRVVCLGEGKSADASTYYLVVEAPALIAFRKQVAREFQKRGGTPGAFKAERFYPHITVGFTDRDLHESDGVIKDRNSCVERLKIR